MRSLEYQGDIADFVTQMRDLNDRVCATGAAYRSIVKGRIPEEIIRMMYNQGGIPLEDEELMAQLVAAGRIVEDIKADEYRKKKSTANHDRPKTEEKKKAPEGKGKKAVRPGKA
jgi:hypothetical protein